VITLVALRLVIGWHFFREGADKIVQGDWTSEGFMKVAKGPLTPFFHWLLWDGKGQARLDKEATLEAWDQYRQRVVDHFRFDEKQAKQAQETYDARRAQLEWFFSENQDEIDQYFLGLERIARYREDPGRSEVASLRGQADQIEMDLNKKLGPWLASIDTMWSGFERDMNNLATDDQARRGKLALPLPGRKLLDTKFIDWIIPYFDLIVGILLIVGLFTRISAIAGAGFLASIIMTQWPWSPGALPTNYQVIEMVSLLVLAAVGAGRFAGLDFFVDLLWRRCCPPKTEKEA
jgi:uncharacterized membrane protein YphA (DoxX/SURF4 family)